MTNPRVERRHLEALVALHKQPAFSKAAQELLITPSALAGAIRQLERMVGEPLVQRTRDGMSLTARGRAMSKTAARGLRAIQAVIEDSRAPSGLHGGELIVHTSPTLAESLAPRLIDRLRARYPGMRILVHAPRRRVNVDIEYAVASGEADFGMSERVGNPISGLRYVPLGTQTMAYAFPSTAARRPAHATFDDIRDYGLITVPEFESSAVYRELRSRSTEIDAWVTARITHRHAFGDLASGGLAGFLCDYDARAELESLGLHVAPFAEPIVRLFSTIIRSDDEREIIQAAIAESENVRAAQSA